MSIKKALLSFVLSAILVLSALSVQSFAESKPITWNTDEKGEHVTLSNEIMTARCEYWPADASVRAFPSNNGKKVYWEMTLNDENGTSAASMGIQYLDGSYKTSYYPESSSDYFSTIAVNTPSRYAPNDVHYDDIRKGDTVSFALNMEIGELKIFRNNQLIKTYSSIDTTKTVAAMTGATNGGSWHEVTANFGMKPFKYAIPAGYKPYDALSPITTEETITIESPTNEVQVGNTFTTDVVLHNATNICAEDVVINYNAELFEYLGSEAVDGFKVYKEMPDAVNGSVRFIVASRGKDYAINGEKTFIKLKFKAKKQGTGLVDSATARIADNATIEKDLKVELCSEKAITVKGIQDVNRSGSFTLLDLGIDAWYHGSSADSTDTTKYDTDVVVDNTIDDLDLSAIVDAMLENSEYKPHNL